MDFHIVTQRQDLIEERIHQLLSRAAGQICPANRSGEEAIADEHFSFSRLEQDYVAGCVTGAVNHFEFQLADFVSLAIALGLISLGRLLVIEAISRPLRLWNANPLRLTGQRVIDEFIRRVNDDFRVGLSFL